MKSYEKPTSSQVESALPLLSSPQHEAYFFSRLENPHWIAPLAEQGIFKSPPQAEKVKGGGTRFPEWPPARYLARMASLAPDEVASIFRAIETDNSSVIGDMVQAALVMPEAVGATLVPSISQASREGKLWIHFTDASELCVRLAEGGQAAAALDLADALFSPTGGKVGELSRRDVYWYRDGLTKVVPVLARVNPGAFLPRLCSWLQTLVELHKHVNADSGSDLSFLWRPAVEEHEQNSDSDLAGAMVGFVREGFEVALSAEGLSLSEALQMLERYPSLIFRRIRLHLIGEFADRNPDLARREILNRQVFGDYKLKHEYATLAGRRLDLLLPQEREEWFGWIDAGPDLSVYEESIRKNLGWEATEDEREGRVRYWQFEKLHWVRDHLDEQQRAFYERMLAQHGEPELADLNFHTSSGWGGDESPMSLEELTALSFEEAVDAVSTWRPLRPQLDGPNRQGLALVFERFVGTNLEDFSSKARLMIGRPSLFVQRFLSQMSEAVKSGLNIDLPAVLELCDWVVQTTSDSEAEWLSDQEDDPFDEDGRWEWTRGEVSPFIRNVCRARLDDAPKYPLQEFRQRLWRLIAPLTQDRAKSNIIYDMSSQDPRVRDCFDLGINSPRGKAVEAACEYARWVANHIKTSEGQREVIPGGLDALPEFREMLEWQIARENRSYEALAIIGSRIGLIYWIDREWLKANQDRLFSLQDIEQGPEAAQGWAAWNAFLVWVRPHHQYFEILKSQYEYAVEVAVEVELPEQSWQQPMHHLGEHLMVLYGRGHLKLDGEDSLLERFLESANADIRRHAIGFVGRSLEGDESVPRKILERFETLWDHYWTGPGPQDAQESPSALLFGTWFSCGKFPQDWALDRLQQFVEVCPVPEPDDFVVEKLADGKDVDIVRTVGLLDRIIRGDREGWRILGWRDRAKQILEAALLTPGSARETAEKLIDYLGRKGYLEFGQLLH